MSTLSKLFSGYTGGGRVAKNDKFSTTKNNHNRNKYGRPTVCYAYSFRFLKLWLKENFDKWRNDEFPLSKYQNNMPSYMNPDYRTAYHQPKHRR